MPHEGLDRTPSGIRWPARSRSVALMTVGGPSPRIGPRGQDPVEHYPSPLIQLPQCSARCSSKYLGVWPALRRLVRDTQAGGICSKWTLEHYGGFGSTSDARRARGLREDACGAVCTAAHEGAVLSCEPALRGSEAQAPSELRRARRNSRRATVSGCTVSSGSAPRSGSATTSHSSLKTRWTPAALPAACAARMRSR